MRFYFWLSAFLLSALSVSAQSAQVADKIIAIVGDNIILQSDVEVAFLQEQSRQTDKVLSPDVKCRIIENLLIEKLFIAQAILDSVVVPDQEIESELDRRVKYFISLFGSREKLESYYGKSILELKDEFRDDVNNQILSDKMRAKAFSGLKVSPEEVKQYFNKIPKDSIPFFNSEIELAQIVMFPKINEEQKRKSREKLMKIKKDIEDGADFSLQAILYSDDPGSSSDGGNLGYIERGELVPDFEAAAYKLNEGQISEIVETPFGFHVIKSDEKRGDRLKLRHILIKPKLMNSDVVLVQERMDSVLNLLRTKELSLREAVNKFSEDETSKSTGGLMTNPQTGSPYFEKADIEGSLIFTIDQMKVGDFSDVLTFNQVERSGENKTGFRIIYLKSETPAHRASLDKDFPKIQSAAKIEKQQIAMDEWIKLNKGNTFIKVEKEFENCPELDNWKNNDSSN
jgi:peptidyl-prolyl cis-trans isomerase SurA